jgi:hypothetical protein
MFTLKIKDFVRGFLLQFALLSIFDVSYQKDKNGENLKENTRNCWNFQSIYFLGMLPKDPKKGMKKNGTLRFKQIAFKVQNLWHDVSNAKQ